MTKACEVIWPWPENEKPLTMVTVATPGWARRYSSARFTAASVRLKEEPGGVWTSTVKKPWSSSGRKPSGIRTKA